MRVIGAHNSVDPLHAIIHVHEGAGLLPVSPDLDLAAVGDQSHLAAYGCRGLLLASLVGAQGSVDVVEAYGPSLEAVVFIIVLAHLFHEELFCTVALFWLGWVSVLFLEIANVRT